MSAPWTGVFPAVTTKFNEDFSLDIPGMEQHFADPIAAGVNGMVDHGTLGENASLSAEEKRKTHLETTASTLDATALT